MNNIIQDVDAIIDKCMVNGERGFPPHSGGIVRAYGDDADKIHGPLQVSAYGVPDYKRLYAEAGVKDGGFIHDLSPEAVIFMKYIGSRGKPSDFQQLTNSTSNPAARQRCLQSCSNRQDCPENGDYVCVAGSGSVANTLLLDGCCKLRSLSQKSGVRQLLSNSSSTKSGAIAQAGTVPSASSPISDYGCACNCTYVSQACCGAKDHLVSQATSLEWRPLEPPNSTTCCDVGTGSIRQGSRGLNNGKVRQLPVKRMAMAKFETATFPRSYWDARVTEDRLSGDHFGWETVIVKR
ncbi:MAG: hypothetical protein Q9223_003161 [Gallowayella weberi]